MPALALLVLAWFVSLAPAPYAAHMQGAVAGFRLAGIEPDGDPLDQVVLDTTLTSLGNTPRLRLIVDSYLENFQPDTTPILPDLLHPNQTAQNLGGFLQGKALITDGAGDVLYLGSFLSEAFLSGGNNAVMTLYGSGAAYGSTVRLKGTFTPRRDGKLSGYLSGSLRLPPAALRQVEAHRNGPRKALKDIINAVTVKPAPMVGRATKGSSGVTLHTGFGTPHSLARRPSLLTIVAGTAALLSFLAGIILYLRDRKGKSLPRDSKDEQPA